MTKNKTSSEIFESESKISLEKLRSLSKNFVFLQGTEFLLGFVLPRASKNLVGPGHPRTSARHSLLKANKAPAKILLLFRGVVGRVVFGAEGHWFDSTSSRHVGTLGKSFTRNCL